MIMLFLIKQDSIFFMEKTSLQADGGCLVRLKYLLKSGCGMARSEKNFNPLGRKTETRKYAFRISLICKIFIAPPCL